MALDTNKLTQKTIETLNASHHLCQEEQHAQLTPIHLAVTLFEDPQGVGRMSAVRVAGEDGWKSVCRCVLRVILSVLLTPCIGGPGTEQRHQAISLIAPRLFHSFI